MIAADAHLRVNAKLVAQHPVVVAQVNCQTNDICVVLMYISVVV